MLQGLFVAGVLWIACMFIKTRFPRLASILGRICAIGALVCFILAIVCFVVLGLMFIL